jgi:hypothetical protein
MEVANTLAYYDTATITAVKCFIGLAPECQIVCQINGRRLKEITAVISLFLHGAMNLS